MAIFNKVSTYNVTYQKLFADGAARNDFQTALNKEGKDGWKPYQTVEINGQLLIFFVSEIPD